MSYGLNLTYSELIARYLPDAEFDNAVSGISLSDEQKLSIREELVALNFSVNISGDGDWRGYNDDLGIEIIIFDDEVGIGLPYWFEDKDEIKEAFDKIHLASKAIEKNTGFITYDMQLGKVVDWDNDLSIMLEEYLHVMGHIASWE